MNARQQAQDDGFLSLELMTSVRLIMRGELPQSALTRRVAELDVATLRRLVQFQAGSLLSAAEIECESLGCTFEMFVAAMGGVVQNSDLTRPIADEP